MEAYVGLGANLGDPMAQLLAGLAGLAKLPGVGAVKASSPYRTAPVGKTDQPSFLNAVARLTFSGGAGELLAGLMAVEAACGRVRAERWGPRLLDLDLLLFGEQVIDEPGLQVPHPEMTRRVFVLAPLAELAPGLIIPVIGQSVASLLAAFSPQELAGQKVEIIQWRS